MSGYPNQPSGYGYGYGGAGAGGGYGGYGAPPPTAQPYASSAYGGQQPPPHSQQSYAPVSAPYGAPSAPYGSSTGDKPPKDKPHQSYGGAGGGHQSYGGAGGGHAYPPPNSYGNPFASLLPSAFPPGTDPSIVACFQVADQDGSGFIDDKELQGVLSSYNQKFSIRTVHLLMYHFTNTNTRKIGPKEFIALFYGLQSWRGIFERFDSDRSGKIDSNELREALLSLGFAVSPVVLDLLVSKFDKSGGKSKAIEYDNFIED
ncbi:probable calcium-binding protein CML49 isoform X2 [Momordica charantia]|uniref:Probable calcium-binding protein CML49 isoform X2 n=1 Tax=Momordica charantia TaxID=3673 RepID=A0A6J1DK77_MOMCH|nr:probable calcium-binding protein CML49 isoform X2 [Momordica charantia]